MPFNALPSVPPLANSLTCSNYGSAPSPGASRRTTTFQHLPRLIDVF